MNFSKTILVILTLCLATFSLQAKPSKASQDFNSTQQQQIEKIVHHYLVNNPEILIEATNVLQKRQRNAFMERVQTMVAENSVELLSADSPQSGNPKGDVAIVEFFDYQCVHCKNMRKVLDTVANTDKNVRIIYKEFPIFGPTSNFASSAALAANKQGKYKVLHDALLGIKEKLTETKVMDIAKAKGFNIRKLKADALSKAIMTELRKNEELGRKLGINATPAFIIAKNNKDDVGKPVFVGGAMPPQQLMKALKDIRSSKNAKN